MKNKILVVTGSRADYGLFIPTLKKIQAHPQLQLVLLITGMHTLKKYGKTISEIKKDGFTINHIVQIKKDNDMLGWLTEEIAGIKEFCSKNRPDLILLLGDRDETLAAALVGSHLGIPIAHIHGGDISGNVTVDDKIRDVITSLSDLHFPTSKESALRIKSILGPKSRKIILLKDFAIEEISQHLLSKHKLAEEYRLNLGRPWILFVMHPSPLDKNPYKLQIMSVLNALKHTKAEIIGIYPNSDTGSDEFLKYMQKSKIFIHLFPSLPRYKYLSFVANVNIFIGNSSSLFLEASYFNTPIINIGLRQHNRKKYKNTIQTDFNTRQIKAAVDAALKQQKLYNMPKYSLTNASNLIIRSVLDFLI